jgi:hypothetical protein
VVNAPVILCAQGWILRAIHYHDIPLQPVRDCLTKLAFVDPPAATLQTTLGTQPEKAHLATTLGMHAPQVNVHLHEPSVNV